MLISYDTLKVMIKEKLVINQDEYDQYRFLPLGGDYSDLETLEMLAETSRVSVVDASAFTPLYRKYGNIEQLRERFIKEIGLTEDAKTIEKVITDIAAKVRGVLVRGEMLIMDTMGAGDTHRVYTWPYIGIRGDLTTIEMSDELVAHIKDQMISLGIDPKRIAELKTNPTNRGDRGHVVAVFLGKE